jgi:hypothetical protein
MEAPTDTDTIERSLSLTPMGGIEMSGHDANTSRHFVTLKHVVLNFT